MGELAGTRIAEPSGLACSAPTTAILLPPAAAKIGGASPTEPMSTEPPLMACSIGGPEVKSDQVTLNGNFPISPAAVSRACEPAPAWSPTCRVTSARLTGSVDRPGDAGADGVGCFEPETAVAEEQAEATVP